MGVASAALAVRAHVMPRKGYLEEALGFSVRTQCGVGVEHVDLPLTGYAAAACHAPF
jgi:hypothetical protein